MNTHNCLGPFPSGRNVWDVPTTLIAIEDLTRRYVAILKLNDSNYLFTFSKFILDVFSYV